MISRRLPAFAALAIAGALSACTPAATTPTKAPEAASPGDEWLRRAEQSYAQADFVDAEEAVKQAVVAGARGEAAANLRAKLALARLDWADAIAATEGRAGADARGYRARALWYAGRIEEASVEIEALLRDPKVRDTWAKDVASLARAGAGRKPYAIESDWAAVGLDLPQSGSAYVVPVELDGKQVLAVVATSTSEVVLDAAAHKEPEWVNLRFGGRFEVRDVPALVKDLSSYSRLFDAPIELLIGTRALRELHATIDRRGSQLVVRREEASAPPSATVLSARYLRGGGLLVPVGFERGKAATRFNALVDSMLFFALTIDGDRWPSVGVDKATLAADPALKKATGIVPVVTVGSFELPRIPAIEGFGGFDVKSAVDFRLDGVVGANLLQLFRITFAGHGDRLWLESDIEPFSVPSATQESAPAPALVAPAPPTPGAP
jgi:hypothetical protein